MSKFSDTNVLVLDEHIEHHEIVRQAIKDIGVTKILNSSTPEEAQQKISSGPIPDLIIMEINLGGAAGLNFMRQIRGGKTAADKDVPIIIMTRALAPETAFRACETGFEHFIRKPFNKEALQKRVASVLAQPRRFVVARSYFGPDRREPGMNTEFQGPERRGAKASASAETTAPRQKTGASDQPAGKPRNGGGAMLDEVSQSTKNSKDYSLVDEAAEASQEEVVAVAVSAKTKEQLKSAPVASADKTPAKKPKIDLVDATETPAREVDPDRAAEIAAKLEAHAAWLVSNGSQGEKANFANEDLSSANLVEANLANANLRSADLQDANLTKANLFDADLRSANLSGAILQEADLHNAKLRHATLKATLLVEAGLRGADFAGANLYGAQLTGADLKDANFLSTNIREADLTGVNLTQKQIDKAEGDHTTTLPPGIRIGAVD